MIFKVFLFLHIIGGSVGLLTGMLNILRKKGDKGHKQVGRIFFLSMSTAGFSALVLSCIHPNYFLFMIGVFTLYLVGTGQRYLKRKQQNNIYSNKMDWIISFLMLLSAILFLAMGILSLIKSNLFGLVFITFGILGLLFVKQDFINYSGKSAIKNYYIIGHLQRMAGGFIAALTAFLVVNAKFFPEQIPGFIYWLLPTFVLTPLIIKWSRKFEIKN